jgi:hypothetical protein
MTAGQLLDLAVLTFKERDLSRAQDADRFFSEYGTGNVQEYPVTPYERFVYYRELLKRLRASDPQKFASIHKGTPLYFLAWLAFDLHQFEAALHFLDASIDEDKRKDPAGWLANPGPQFLLLNAPVQAARRTVEMLASRVELELNRFAGPYNITFTRADFLGRFAEPMLRAGTGGIVAAFYAFLLEFDDRVVEVELRSSPLLGSYQPLFLHLFKGGLLLETLLKQAFPELANSTLGDILQHQDFRARVGITLQSIREVPLATLCAEALATTPESAFLATGRIRNTMGHNLIRDPLPNLPSDYVILVRQEINAFLYAVTRLYP